MSPTVLQAALLRGALHLVAEGIASLADVDKGISARPGLRWALMGPNLTFHLAGGLGGIDHFISSTNSRRRWRTGGRPWAIRR